MQHGESVNYYCYELLDILTEHNFYPNEVFCRPCLVLNIFKLDLQFVIPARQWLEQAHDLRN